jgi:hypothetical protein
VKYKNYIKYLSEKFLRRLDDVNAVYGYEYGNEFEIALCEILREFLPQKYGICRGFVVSETGDIAGDDIIIYDQFLFPTLKLRNSIARKEMIPIEAVYAYIEAKNAIEISDIKSRQSINKALDQVRKVKQLCLTRTKRPLGALHSEFPPLFHIDPIDDMPSYQNPIYTAIIAGSIKINGIKIGEEDKIRDGLSNLYIDRNDNNPELIVFNQDNYWATGYYYDNTNTSGIETLFKHESKTAFYGTHNVDKLSYGLFLAYLMASLNFITLGKMPWNSMINEIIIP